MSQIQSGNEGSQEGYQEVQIGPEELKIPGEWTVTTVNDVASRFISGGTPNSSNEDYWGGQIPWTTAAVVEGPQFDGEKDFITQEGLENSSASLVPAGSILFGTRVNVANVGRTTKEIAISQDLTGIILDESKVDPEFVVWHLLLNQAKIRDRYSQGSTIQGMLTDDLKSLPLLSPPLSEQHRIANILSTVEEQIQQTDEIIENLKELKNGLIQDLFQQGTQGEERAAKEIGPITYNIPKSWEIIPAEKVCSTITVGIVSGATDHYVEDGVPFVRSKNIEVNRMNDADLKYIDREFHENNLNSELHSGDILTQRTGQNGGMTAVVPDRYEGANCFSMLISRTNDRINEHFYAYYLNSQYSKKFVESRKGGGVQKNLNAKFLRQLPVFLPPIDEQKSIVEILSKVDQKIDEEVTFKEKLSSVKRGLMKDLLTGKVRVSTD